MTLKYSWRSFSLGCHFHVHFSYPWHAFASHGLPAIAELLVVLLFFSLSGQTSSLSIILFFSHTFCSRETRYSGYASNCVCDVSEVVACSSKLIASHVTRRPYFDELQPRVHVQLYCTRSCLCWFRNIFCAKMLNIYDEFPSAVVRCCNIHATHTHTHTNTHTHGHTQGGTKVI